MWRLPAGILAGILLTTLFSIVFTLFPVVYDSVPSNRVAAALGIVFWAVGAFAVGAFSGWVAGRLEVLVAVGSVILGFATLRLLPQAFVLGDDFMLYFLSVPFTLIAIFGGTWVFFARRTDLR